MPTIEQLIAQHRAEILHAWADEAARAAGARGLSRPELVNVLPKYVDALARRLDGEARRERSELIESHLSSRLRAGFQLDEVLDELSILRRVIARVWLAEPPDERPRGSEMDGVASEIDMQGARLQEAFREYLALDEQSEKRFLRLLDEAFRMERDGEPPLSVARLKTAIELVMEAMDAKAAALLLHDVRTGALLMSGSAGEGAAPLDSFARAADESSFAGQVAARESATSLHDVETTLLEVPDELRHSGIHSLLGVRIPAHRALLGVMYIGIREVRPFTAREARRIEAMGERLALLLDNAKLYADQLEQIAALHAERRVRRQFVSILAHDLRGPITSARMAAELLVRANISDAVRGKNRAIVLRSLDRAERMIGDLLDVDRLHDGKRLELVVEPCDFAEIARHVVAELDPQAPGRLALHADEDVTGVWSRSQLERALWNLVTNALKYGAAGAPVVIELKRHDDGAELRVHNEGDPIPSATRATLFEPFMRADETGRSHGWGLGLTLVRGCAEAHGGSVAVDSAPGRGTTFTMRIPWNAPPARRAG